MRKTKAASLAAGVALALALAVPTSASAAIKLGSTFTAISSCVYDNTYVQASSAGNPYAAPSDGVITSWAHHAGASPPSLRFKVVRPLGGASFALVGESDSTAQTAFVLNEFPTRIPVHSGDIVGLYFGGIASYNCLTYTGLIGDVLWYVLGDVQSGNTTFEASGNFKLDVSAQFEFDADRDGFGDETQDQCPTDASTQGACPSPPNPTYPGLIADNDPPETTITKRAPHKSHRRAVRFKFHSDEPGSTFECKLDRRRWRRCSSPKRVRHLRKGRHKFRVRARDPAGNVDPSPAKDRFKIVG